MRRRVDRIDCEKSDERESQREWLNPIMSVRDRLNEKERETVSSRLVHREHFSNELPPVLVVVVMVVTPAQMTTSKTSKTKMCRHECLMRG